jgi:integrase
MVHFCTFFAHGFELLFVTLCLKINNLIITSMARKKLFSTPEELFEGYFGDFSTQKGRKKGVVEARKVTLKGRMLKDGKISLYLYSCINGNVSRTSMGSFLNIETDPTIKAQNEETIRLARTKADLMNADAEREENGFRPIAKSKANLIEYTLKVADDALAKTNNKHGYYYNLQALARHLKTFRGDKIRLSDVDKDFILAFVAYLRNDASNINYLRAEDKEKWKDISLSGNSQHRLFANLHYVIKKAVKARILPRDPFLELDAEDKPKENTGTREYLTTGELKRLIDTPIKNEMIKRAFLFSCFCGLRWSDVSRLRWGDLKTDDVGFFADVTMVKTKRQVKAYISDIGSQWIPEREENATDKDLVFKLPKNEHVNVVLKQWAKDAKIKKTVSFHVSRHTAATMLLNLDVPLEVVAKQLGHGKISTTQIYAKILGKTQKAAIDKQNDLFK